MAVALRGAAVVPTGNPTTGFTLVIPSAVVAGDVLFLPLTSRDSTGAGTLAVTDNDSGGNTWSKIGNSTDHKATLWYKRATSATASKTITVANAVGSSSGVLKCFSGADSGSVPYSQVTIETNAAADETHAGFTPTRANAMLCAAIFNYANDNAVTALNFATAGATTFTEKLSTGGNDCSCAFGHLLQSGGPSATGNLTWTQADGTTYSISWIIREPLTLTAAGTSYSQSGTAASLKYNRLPLAAASGSYLWSRTDANPEYHRKLIAASASYAMTGSAADLIYEESGGYTLTADPGSYSQTGTAAALLFAHRLSAAGSSYAQSGTAADLRATRKLTAAASSYAMSGSAADLSKGIRLIAASGSFAMSGSAANFLVAHRLSAAAASYALSGTAANLRSARRLSAAGASYTWNPSAADLRKGITMPAAAGSFQMSAAAADLRATRRLSAASASYIWTPSAATLDAGFPVFPVEPELEYGLDIGRFRTGSGSAVGIAAAGLARARFSAPHASTASIVSLQKGRM